MRPPFIHTVPTVQCPRCQGRGWTVDGWRRRLPGDDAFTGDCVSCGGSGAVPLELRVREVGRSKEHGFATREFLLREILQAHRERKIDADKAVELCAVLMERGK